MWELVDWGSWILRYTAVASVIQSPDPVKPLRVSLTSLSPFGLIPCVFLIPEGRVQKSLPTFSLPSAGESAETFVPDPRPFISVCNLRI